MAESDREHIAVYLHILFAAFFIGATVGLSLLRFTALSVRDDPKKVATLHTAARPLVIVLVTGLLLLITFGGWAVYETGNKADAPWLALTYAFVSWMLIAGVVAGRHDKRTRILAQRVADDGLIDLSKEETELKQRLVHPLPLVLNASMLVGIVIVLAMMVFRPGAVEGGAE